MRPSAICDRLSGVPLISVFAACLAASEVEPCELLSTYLTSWRHITPSITGTDLMKRGLPPGPAYKKIIGTLRRAWLDGLITKVEQENVLLEQLLLNEIPETTRDGDKP